MEMPAAAQRRRGSTVVERKLDKLCVCLDDALSCRQRGPGAEARLAADIKTDFLRLLVAAEAECHGGARPEHLAEAEERFAVLGPRSTVGRGSPWLLLNQGRTRRSWWESLWKRPCSESSGFRSTCWCTDSCQEAAPGDAVEARKEVTADGVAVKGHDADRGAAGTRGEAPSDAAAAKKPEAMGTRDAATPKGAVGKKREAMETPDAATPNGAVGKKRDSHREAPAETGRRTVVQRRWWRRGTAWCGAACVIAVVVVVELAAVAHHNANIYVVPT